MHGRPLHHVALTPRNHERSTRFYCEGLGLEPIVDLPGLHGDWKHIFDAPSNELRSIFFGSPDFPQAGVVELVVFSDDDARATRPEANPNLVNGFFLLSFYVTDVEATLARLEELGMSREPRVTRLGMGDNAFTVATVRDPDGTLVELVGREPDRGLIG